MRYLIILELIAGLATGDLAGLATVTDGDGLRIGQQKVRLWGIDAPEARQTCERGGEIYRCGAEATKALRDIVSGPVGCERKGISYDRVVARCFVGGADIAAEMVRQGWALDWPKYSKGAYASEQAEARAHRRGMHAGTFDAPWDWR